MDYIKGRVSGVDYIKDTGFVDYIKGRVITKGRVCGLYKGTG